MTIDEKWRAAVAITDRETKAWLYGHRAAGQNQYIGDATKLWALNTLAEHFRALSPSDDPVGDAQVLENLDALADQANAAFDSGHPLPAIPTKLLR